MHHGTGVDDTQASRAVEKLLLILTVASGPVAGLAIFFSRGF